MRFAVLSVVLILAMTAAASVPPAPEGFRLGGDAARGKRVFGRSCALCHGETGNGVGRMKNLDPKPADFTDKGVMGSRSDWEIYLAVRDGGQAVGRSPKMFGWSKLLTDQEIRDVCAYVRSLSEGLASPSSNR